MRSRRTPHGRDRLTEAIDYTGFVASIGSNLEQQCVMPWDLHHVIRLQVCIGRHRPRILEPPLLPEVHGMRECGPRRFIIREWVPAEADDATSVFRRVRP